ncbi:MAG: hypothetical protein ACI910_000304 [Oleispira sp.]|jgi:hypothetical protein
MLIAGITEFLIIGSILYALATLPSQHGHISTLYRVALLVTLTAASLGAVKFLTSIQISDYHQFFTYISKHVALTAFIITGAWGVFKSKQSKIIAAGIVAASLISFIVNFSTDLPLLSIIIMLLALVFTAFNMRSNPASLRYLIIAILVLLSTLLWGAIIKDRDTMIGVYHACVGLFYVLITLSFKGIEGNQS